VCCSENAGVRRELSMWEEDLEIPDWNLSWIRGLRVVTSLHYSFVFSRPMFSAKSSPKF
jgi:hypothetical protein